MIERHSPTDGTPLYEGPAHPYVAPGIHGSQYTERMANDGASFFTSTYGEQGVGWDFDPSTHAGQNAFYKFGNDIERNLALEALRNRANPEIGELITDDGIMLSQRQVEDMVLTDQPDRGTLIIYPNGDLHASERGPKK